MQKRKRELKTINASINQEGDDMSMTGGFVGRVAFVTGAANGIGRAAAIAFAHEGASVVVADVSEERNS